MRKLLALLMAVHVIFGQQLWAAQASFQQDGFVDKNKKVYTIWHNIPFYSGGDIAQYQATMAQNRDEVRKALVEELTEALTKLGNTGAPADAMLEPLADIILMFDEMHDLHKARDVIKINFSLENQFKASLDTLFLENDIRESARKIQISRGADPVALNSYIQGKSISSESGKKFSHTEPSLQHALNLYNQIDYASSGTFSSLGNNDFQLTLQLQNLRNGATRGFIARGRLIPSVDELAREVFEFFQRNDYPDWEAPQQNLQWLAMPANPLRDNPNSNAYGYSFQEALSYCLDRGYRLPYARELLSAEAGGAFKKGGINHLQANTSYPVLDRRHVNSNHVLRAGEEQSMGGSIRPTSSTSEKGKFWCVKGSPAPRVMLHEQLWSLHRKNQAGDGSNKEIFAAVETLRFELGDSDTDMVYYNNLSGNNLFEKLQRLDSVEEALEVLRRKGISIEIPASMRVKP